MTSRPTYFLVVLGGKYCLINYNVYLLTSNLFRKFQNNFAHKTVLTRSLRVEIIVLRFHVIHYYRLLCI